MWPVSATYLAALSASHGRSTRMEVWFDGARVAANIPVESGTVQVTARNRIRRASAVVVPEAYWPTSASSTLAPYGARLKLYQSILGVDGDLIGSEAPIFAGRIEATPERLRKSGKFTIQAKDPFAEVNDLQFEKPFTAPAGAGTVATIIALIAEAVPTAMFVDLTRSLARLPVAQMWNTDRGQAVDDLAASIGAEVFFLPDGDTCVIRPVPVLGGASVWSLVQGQNSTIVRDLTGRTRTDVANRLVVHVEQSGQTPYDVTVTDDDPASATRFGGPFGRVVRHYYNQLIASPAQAQTAGEARLARILGVTRTRDVDIVPNPALEAGDLITIITDEGAEQHIVDTFTLPLSVADVMTVETRSTGTSTG